MMDARAISMHEKNVSKEIAYLRNYRDRDNCRQTATRLLM
jgi:hypothetical protein